MFIHVRYALLVAAVNMASGVSSAINSPPDTLYRSAQKEVSPEPVKQLSVMTYNIKGLPWPIATGREEAIKQIGERLRLMREQGAQPHAILLQEAFGDTARQIATQAGYRHIALGPDVTDKPRYGFSATISRDWSRGEAIGKRLNSGLAILSDFPITSSETLAFGDQACAGFDCLANKGVMKATIRVPGQDAPLLLFNTHLNARTASAVPVEKANHAFRRQLALTARFISDSSTPETSMIIGGDFNIGKDEKRRSAFTRLSWSRRLPAFASLSRASGIQAMNAGLIEGGQGHADMTAINHRTKDLIFADPRLVPVDAAIPFGTEPDGSSLSDHMGYQIDYAFGPDPAQRALRMAANAASDIAKASQP